MELVNQSEIARRVKLSRERIGQLARADPAFPRPVVPPDQVGRQRLYLWKAIESYFDQRNPKPGRPASPDPGAPDK